MILTPDPGFDFKIPASGVGNVTAPQFDISSLELDRDGSDNKEAKAFLYLGSCANPAIAETTIGTTNNEVSLTSISLVQSDGVTPIAGAVASGDIIIFDFYTKSIDEYGNPSGCVGLKHTLLI